MTGFRVLDLPPAHRRFLGCSVDLSRLEAWLSTPMLATLAQLTSLGLWRRRGWSLSSVHCLQM